MGGFSFMDLGGGQDSQGRDYGKGPSSKIMGFIDRRKQDRKNAEFNNQQRNERLFNYDQAVDAYDRQLDLAPQMSGALSADYDSPNYHLATDRDQIGGGALQTQLEMAQGYNPTMAHNPYLQVFDADAQGVASLQQAAEQSAEDTLSGWEASQGELADDLKQSFADIRDDRDQMRDDYTAAIEDSREEKAGDQAQHIIESWIESNDEGGAMGGPGRGDDFVRRRGIGGRRIKGASGTKKRAYIADRLAAGESYADILNDKDFVDLYISKDAAAGDLYGRWEG